MHLMLLYNPISAKGLRRDKGGKIKSFSIASHVSSLSFSRRAKSAPEKIYMGLKKYAGCILVMQFVSTRYLYGKSTYSDK